MNIYPCTLQDLETLFWFYDQAIAFQKKAFGKHWLGFDKERVTREIEEGRQFKVMDGGQVVGVFLVTFDDPVIWKELDLEPAIYLHRIVTHPEHRGKGLVPFIVQWATSACISQKRSYVRLDTWRDNHKLVEYYKSCGFQFVRHALLDDISELPSHYQWELTLLQIPV